GRTLRRSAVVGGPGDAPAAHRGVATHRRRQCGHGRAPERSQEIHRADAAGGSDAAPVQRGRHAGPLSTTGRCLALQGSPASGRAARVSDDRVVVAGGFDVMPSYAKDETLLASPTRNFSLFLEVPEASDPSLDRTRRICIVFVA